MRVLEALDFESDHLNWKFTFDKMTKKYGKEYIIMLKAMWQANGDCQTISEFITMNGISLGFFEKVVKNG